MKIYEQAYENTYCTKERKSKYWKPDLMEVHYDMSLGEYITAQRVNWDNLVRDHYAHVFRMIWLNELFTYMGKFSHYTKYVMGYVRGVKSGFFQSRQTVSNQTRIVARWVIKNYFTDFYRQDIFSNSEKYQWPFKCVTPEMVMAVVRVHYAKELIDYAEEQRMGYGTFIDFIGNQVQCRNEDPEFAGEQQYQPMNTALLGTYFTRKINYEQRKRDKKAEASSLRQRNLRQARSGRFQAKASAKRHERYERSKKITPDDWSGDGSGRIPDFGQDVPEEGLSQGIVETGTDV